MGLDPGAPRGLPPCLPGLVRLEDGGPELGAVGSKYDDHHARVHSLPSGSNQASAPRARSSPRGRPARRACSPIAGTVTGPAPASRPSPPRSGRSRDGVARDSDRPGGRGAAARNPIAWRRRALPARTLVALFAVDNRNAVALSPPLSECSGPRRHVGLLSPARGRGCLADTPSVSLRPRAIELCLR